MIDKLFPILCVATAAIAYILANLLIKWAIKKDVERELEEEWGESYTQYKKKK